MVEIQIEYQGDLRCKAVHGPTGTTLITDVPQESHGRGESFSPTDLVAAALGSCILSLMGITARSLKVDIGGARATVEKEMVNQPVRKIVKFTVKIHVPHSLSEEHQRQLTKAALTCPVHKSMHQDVQMEIDFSWG